LSVVRPNWYAVLVQPELSREWGPWFNRPMLISILLFVCMSGCGFLAIKLVSAFRRLRWEARMGRAIRMSFSQ